MSQYKVMIIGNHSRRLSYQVTNRPDDWDTDWKHWPHVAEFAISAGYSDEDQRNRAIEYCDYMNRTTQKQPPIGT